jgi:hemolysin activation/secretion protein
MGVNTANKTLKSGQLTLEGNSGDRSIFLGQNSWFFNSALTMGQVSDSANTNASSYAPLGSYTKLAFQGVGKVILSREHSIFGVLNVRGQFATTNLDPYEKMLIGGATALRAYSVEQGSVNQGAIISAELRKTLNTEFGQLQPVVFIDYLNGQINNTTYPNWQTNLGYSNPNLSNYVTASNVGVGMDWTYFNKYSLSVSWARRLPGSPIGTYGNGNSQFWFLAQARF